MYLWSPVGEPPWELTSYILRRDVYHCTADALDEADWEGVAADIAIRNAIAKVSNR